MLRLSSLAILSLVAVTACGDAGPVVDDPAGGGKTDTLVDPPSACEVFSDFVPVEAGQVLTGELDVADPDRCGDIVNAELAELDEYSAAISLQFSPGGGDWSTADGAAVFDAQYWKLTQLDEPGLCNRARVRLEATLTFGAIDVPLTMEGTVAPRTDPDVVVIEFDAPPSAAYPPTMTLDRSAGERSFSVSLSIDGTVMQGVRQSGLDYTCGAGGDGGEMAKTFVYSY